MASAVHKETRRRLPGWVKLSAGVITVAAVLFGITYFLLPMGLNQTDLRFQLERQIADLSGITFSVNGDTSISFFPLRVELTDVSSKDALGAVTINAKRVEARFSATSALVGQIDVKSITLDSAHVTVRRKPDSQLDAFGSGGLLGPAIKMAKAAIDADHKVPDLASITNRSLGSVRFANSTLSLIRADGHEDLLQNVNADFSWRTLRGGAAMSGSADWRGEAFKFDLDVSSPLLLASGGTSAVIFNFSSAPLNFSFNGDCDLSADFFGDGNLTLTAASISKVLSWSATPMHPASDFGSVDLAGRLTASKGIMKFGDLQLSLDSKPATGTLEVDLTEDIAKLAGTLAFESVDLSSLVQSSLLDFAGGAPGMERSAPFSGLALDLRLSATSAGFGAITIKNAAGTIRHDAGTTLLDIGNGELAGGDVSGSLQLSGGSTSRNAALKFSARGVKLGEISTNPTLPKIDAPVNLKFELSGPFKTLPEFLQVGEGALSAEAAAGIIRNFSADSFAGAVGNGQIFALPETYSGLSTLETAVITAKLTKGAALVEASEVNINGHRIVLTGAIPYVSGGVALNGVIAGQGNSANWTPFFIGGSWDKPFVTLVPLQQ